MRLRLIMVLVIGPLLALAGYFAFIDIGIQRARLAHAHDIAFKTVEKTLVNTLVHEMQKERGYSAGFLASGGKKFPDKLKEQRRITGQSIDEMQREVTEIFAERSELAAEIQGNLDALSQMRARVDGLALKVPEMAKFYTQTINMLLEMARPELKGEASTQLQGLMQTNVLIAAAKEQAGLERAMGATGLGGGFTGPVYDRFVALGGGNRPCCSKCRGRWGNRDGSKRCTRRRIMRLFMPRAKKFTRVTKAGISQASSRRSGSPHRRTGSTFCAPKSWRSPLRLTKCLPILMPMRSITSTGRSV